MECRINIGCGQTPIQGWRNFDNSLSIRFSAIPILPKLLKNLNLLTASQFNFILFARNNKIEYADAANKLPLKNETVSILYSSHMLEHLDRIEADNFLREAFRVLKPGGIVRIVVPDIKIQVEEYLASGDSDAFVAKTLLSVSRPRMFSQRLKLLLVGARHHQWMYDGKSLSGLLNQHGFVSAEIMPAGKTNIPEYEPLDINERAEESVYVEAEKPR